jgi:hypothetical protein
MAAVNKIDSNVTGLRYAEEQSYKVLPGSPVWYPLEPNSYDDFGSEITTIARDPINEGRQKKFGVVTDLDAMAGFQTDLTQTNLQDILQGFMFADFRNKTEFTGSAIAVTTNDYAFTGIETGFAVGALIHGSGFTNSANNGLKRITSLAGSDSLTVAETLAAETSPTTAKIVEVGVQAGAGDIDVAVTGDYARYTSVTLDFTTLGLIPGEWIFVGGDSATLRFTNAANNGLKRVRSVSANALVVDKSATAMVLESSTTETIQIFFGRVLKNETGTDIVRRSYQLERTLGAPDDSNPGDYQVQYVVGAVPNEMTLNINTADKITADLTFMAADDEQYNAVTGEKTGTRPSISEAAAFNTSSDVTQIKMAVHSTTSETPTPLFAYVTDLAITLNNNVQTNKAVGTLGAFDVTAGQFEVSAELTAYFADIASVTAVRNNSQVSLYFFLAKDNAGIACDLPLISLGDGKVQVEQNEPITIPLTAMAATAALIDTNLNHTLLWSFFDYLPDLAE